MAITQGSLTDVNGDGLTSQLNGTQQALDIGINVDGNQVDPRIIRPLDSGTDSINVSGTVSVDNIVDVNVNQSVPLEVMGAKGTFTDFSGTVGTSSTSKIPANPNRKYLLIQNVSGNKLYINFTSAATTGSGSIFLGSNASIVMEGNFVSTEEVFMISDKVNTVFTAKEA